MDYDGFLDAIDKDLIKCIVLYEDEKGNMYFLPKAQCIVGVEYNEFTDEEMELLWNHVDDKNYADLVIIQCYGGWRPQELGLIELENVDLDKWIMVVGIKVYD